MIKSAFIAAALALAPLTAAATEFAAESSLFQLVLEVEAEDSQGVLLYLADADSNAPVSGAAIEAEAGDWRGSATATAQAGLYRLAWSPPPAGADLTLTVTAPAGEDLLLLPQVRRSPPPLPSGEDQPRHWLHWSGGGILGALAAALLAVLLRRRRSSALVLALAIAVGTPSLGWAHAGHDHGAGTPTAPTALPGAQVSMSKATQFLLGIQTQRIEVSEITPLARVVGRVVPDPSGFARLQPSQPARVMADPAFPLPVPGQTVQRGQVIAVLEPVLSSLERSDKRAALVRVDGDVLVQERDLARLEALGANVAPKALETARIRLEQARRERAQIAGTALGRELVVAPLDGVVSDIHIVPGEVVAPGAAMVEIVAPDRLRIEAVIHDLALADRVTAAQAAAPRLAGQSLPLTLLGISPKVDPLDQGVHALFAVAPDQARQLRIGMPVDVFLSSGAARRGLAVPRGAIVESGGRQVVFVRTAPQRFEVRPVKVDRLAGAMAELSEGLTPGERVVVQGAEQMKAAR